MREERERQPGRSSSLITINFQEIFHVLLNEFWTIVIAALVFAIAATAYNMYFVQPDYRTDFTAYINNRTARESVETLQSGDISAGQSLTRTYAAIMVSQPVIEEAIQYAGLDHEGYTYANVIGGISTGVETNAQLMHLYVTLDDPVAAYYLCTSIAVVAPRYIASIVEGSSMRIVTMPSLPSTTHSPNIKRNAAAAGLVGALLMILAVVVRVVLDQSVKSEQDLEKHFDIPVIGVISNQEAANENDLKYGNGYGGKQ